MPAISAQLDLSGLSRKLKLIPERCDAIMHRELKRNMRLLVSSSGKVPGLVQVTPPHSKGTRGTAARKQGEAMLTADIWRVYGTPGNLYALVKAKLSEDMAKAFWKAIKKKDWEAANKITMQVAGLRLQEFDDGAAHRKMRGKTSGRVSKRHVKTIYIANSKWVERYIKDKKKNVGLLAAAPLAAARSNLEGEIKGVPDWVDRHHPAWSTIMEGGKQDMRYIELVISAPYVVAGMQRRFRYVLEYRLAAMKRETPYILKAELKKQKLLASS